ncbi:MAG TPA: nucleotide exchange factor GrpE [Anaeromyxobacter sp.]
MSDERRDASAEGEPRVKVTDRRRFTPEGEPLAGAPADAPRGADPEPSEPAAPSVPADGDPRIAEQAARIDELSRAYAALLEDNKAFRQRQERERARLVESERAGIAQALLESADDLERALAAVSGALDGGGDALRGLVDGVRLSLGGLHKRIADIGAVRIAVAGQPFDPRIAEAVDAVPVASADQDGIVLQEVRPGWRIGERILRPARVRVGRLAQA